MTEKMISFRYDDKTEQALQEIAYHLQTQVVGVMVNRSDAIRYAIRITHKLVKEAKVAAEL